MTRPNIEIRRVGVEKILDLRHRILRAGLPRQSACFEGDESKTTLHFAALTADASGQLAGQVVGCLSLMLNSFEAEPAWQLRGMAIDEPHQGRGIGRQLMIWAEKAAAAEGKAGWLWCNARLPAAGFYQKQGWTAASEVFEIPTAGPHIKMRKRLERANLRETVEKTRGND